ncbi:MAG: IS30 family transposase [Rhizobiales bacterium]|nr:IS30 family transposase [Hyphomicrobiales bacterium]
MGTRYQQLCLDDRFTIARLHAEGRSLRQIAAALDRAPSTISRELKRNFARQTGYGPAYAEAQAKARRWKGSRLDRKPGLRSTVLAALASGWSPEQVAGRLALEHGAPLISHESIYRFIYAQIKRTNDFSWRRLLPRAKAKRGFRGRKGGSPASFIQGRVPIELRPAEAQDRSQPGHWEADLMMFAKYGQNILALHDRCSRLLLATRPPSKAAEPTAQTLLALMAPLPQPLRQTMTFDNGTEFARHQELNRIAMQTFFCDPHAPWQKGGIENAIGRMRRFLPRKTDLATISDQHFNALLQTYNNTPRKCLDFQTPAEVFCQKLLHFKCESTSRLSPG